MKTAESYSASIVMNTDMSSKYVEKKKNVAYMQHLIMMIECVASEMYQQDTDVSTAIEIIQCES